MRIFNTKLFTFSALFVLGVNSLYVMNNIPPDGRWKLQIPVTSLFVLLYLAISILINNRFIKNPKNINFIPVFNIFLSLIFLVFARKIEVIFQYVDILYLKYIATSSYIVILGSGAVLSIGLAIFLERSKAVNNNSLENNKLN